MNNKILGIVVAGFVLLFGQLSYADSDSTGCGGRLKHMVQSLKLDESQQTKIKAIKEQLKTDIKPNWEKMKALRVQINQQVQSNNMDSSKLNDLINTKVQLIGAVIKAKINAQHQIYGVLNSQQKVQYQEMKKNWEEKLANKHEKCKENDNDD